MKQLRDIDKFFTYLILGFLCIYMCTTWLEVYFAYQTNINTLAILETLYDLELTQ